MIPEFPEFKKIELTDRKEIEGFAHKHPLYSDFNFTSMWSWNIQDKMVICWLNKNLVVRFTDYITGEPFFSFLGTHEVSDTVKKLLDYAKQEGIESALKLIPEETIKDIDLTKFVITEDRDNFDYIVSVDKLKKFEGGEFMSKRNYVKRFKQTHDLKVEFINLKDPKIKEQVFNLFTLWQTHKTGEIDYSEHESISISRFLKLPDDDYDSVISTGIYNNEKLIAFWILEKINGNFCMSHYEKMNLKEYVGIKPHLAHESAKLLSDVHNIEFINLEQDLGIPGLRESKKAYAPVNYLKQYTVTHKDA